MNNNVLVTLSLFLLTTISSFAASDSTDISLKPFPTNPAKNAMIMCPEIHVGGTLLDSSTKTVSLGTPDCVSGPYAGAMAWVAGVTGGGITPKCPTDHPYLGSLTEGFGGVTIVFGFPGSGGGGVGTQCCSTPQPAMYAQFGYDSSTGSSTWQVGPGCP